MIKIFGRQLFFKFHHIIYNYNLQSPKKNCSLVFERIVDGLERVDIGYFSIPMLKRVLRKNPKKSECYMALSNDRAEVIGFALISYKGAKEIHYAVEEADAFITALGLFPKHRGKGYSQELLEGVANICRAKGLKKLKLSVDKNNVVAIKSYEKFGFTIEQEKKFIRVASVDFLVHKSV